MDPQTTVPTNTEKVEPTRSLSPPPGGLPVIYTIPVDTLYQDRPGHANRRRLRHLLACIIVFFGAMHLFSTGDIRKFVFELSKLNSTPALSQPQELVESPDCEDLVNWTTHTLDSHDKYPYHASSVFSLPLDAAELVFVANGTRAYGSFTVAQSDNLGAADAVVELDVSYRQLSALKDATVCRTHSESDRWGLGIFTEPQHPHHEQMLRFDIHLVLPAVESQVPLKMNALRTDLPLFTHALPELADMVYFREVELKSANMPVTVESLASDVITVSTMNAAIHGTFNASESLVLKTANAPIVVRANLLNGDKNNGNATHAALSTSNSNIDSVFGLYANFTSPANASSGAFHVRSSTANAPLTLVFADAPAAGSFLDLHASTALAPARVTTHETFEGAFKLATSPLFVPEVSWPSVTRDGTRRWVDTTRGGRSVMEGTTAWGEHSAGGRGVVRVETSVATLRLNLGDLDAPRE